MKKIGFVFLLLASLFCITACTSNTSKEPANLLGTWRQVNSNSETSWQEAEITDGMITIYWVSDNGDTKSLYWVGTYTAPTTTDEPYTWSSEGDTAQMEKALLASQDESKEFTFENNQISYSVSALGTTTTVKLEKQE